jgi:hypothetical protein
VPQEEHVVGFIVNSDDERLRHGGHGELDVSRTMQDKAARIGEFLVVD